MADGVVLGDQLRAVAAHRRHTVGVGSRAGQLEKVAAFLDEGAPGCCPTTIPELMRQLRRVGGDLDAVERLVTHERVSRPLQDAELALWVDDLVPLALVDAFRRLRAGADAGDMALVCDQTGLSPWEVSAARDGLELDADYFACSPALTPDEQLDWIEEIRMARTFSVG